MNKTRKYFLFLTIVFLLFGLGTLAASDVSTDDVSVTKTMGASNTKIVKENTNTIKENVKTDNNNLVTDTKGDKKEKSKEIKKTDTKTSKTDGNYDVNNFTAFQDALAKSGTVNVNVLSNIDLGDSLHVSSEIGKLTINGNGKTINGQRYQFLTYDHQCNVTITDINVKNCTSSYSGGAIYSFGNLTILNSNFTENYALGPGGVICHSGSLTVENSNFSSNNASEYGGAIDIETWEDDCILNVTNSTFFNNTIEQNIGTMGGAISINVMPSEEMPDLNNPAYITNTKFIANNAMVGGAVLATGGKLYLNDSTFEVNDAMVGGAVFASANLTITNTNFTSNNAMVMGGAVFFLERKAEKLTIIDSTFLNNSVGYGNDNDNGVVPLTDDGVVPLTDDGEVHGMGGALLALSLGGNDEEVLHNPVDIIKSKFIENDAGYGGAIVLNRGTLIVNDTTLENNTAKNCGGAIYGDDYTNIISNGSVFTNNYALLGGAVYLNESSNVTMEKTTLKANTASNGATVTGEELDTIKIGNCEFYDNYVSDQTGYVVDLSCAENVIIVDTYFENNTDNARDMLFSDVEETVVEIHGNTYIDNYLAVNMTKLADSDVRGLTNETLTYPVKVTVRNIYNHTIDTGDVFYKSEFTNGSNPVTNNQSAVTLDNKKLLNNTNLVGYNYTSLRKHYQSAKGSFNVLKEMKNSQIKVEVLDDIRGETKIKIYVFREFIREETLMVDTPLVITLPDGSTIETKTGRDGTVALPLDLPAGENILKIEYEGDISTKPASETVTIIVTPTPTSTTISITDSTAGNVVVTGKITDKFDNNVAEGTVTIKNGNTVVGTVKVTDGTYNVLTNLNSKGPYTIYAEFNGTKNYLPSNSSKLAFDVTARKPVIKLDPVRGVIGENITFTAYLTDENGTNITGGNIAFKLNGKTLRSDGRFDSTAPAMKFSVKNGLVTYTFQADLYLRNAKNLTVSYSGNHMYAETASGSVEAQIQKRNAGITVTAAPNMVKQYETIRITATVKDLTKNSNNDMAISQDTKVMLKVNGKTLKDNDNNTLYLTVDKNGQAVYDYVVPAGTGGVKNGSLINYNLEAVFVSDNYYPDVRNSTIFNIEQSSTTFTIKEVKVDNNNVLSVKANITDYKKNLLVGTNKVSIKVNGLTLKNETGDALIFNVTDGVVDLRSIQVDANTTVKRVMLVTGERQAYAGARVETDNIIRV